MDHGEGRPERIVGTILHAEEINHETRSLQLKSLGRKRMSGKASYVFRVVVGRVRVEGDKLYAAFKPHVPNHALSHSEEPFHEHLKASGESRWQQQQGGSGLRHRVVRLVFL